MIGIRSEGSALHGLKRKNQAALEWVIETYGRYVSTIVYGIIGETMGMADVEEVSSDVFLTLWMNAQKVEPGKLKAYISAIARNKAREKLRSIGRELPLEEDFIADTDLQGDMEKKEQAAFLRQAIDDLGLPDREIFLRHYYYCQGISLIAEEMKLSESNVKIRLYRGRKKLKDILLKGGYAVGTEDF